MNPKDIQQLIYLLENNPIYKTTSFIDPIVKELEIYLSETHPESWMYDAQ